MRLSPAVRTILGLSFGLIWTAVVGGFTLLAGLTVRILSVFFRPMRQLQDWFELVPKRWSAKAKEVTYRFFMQIEPRLYGHLTLRKAREDETTVVIADHPSTSTLILFVWFVTHFISPRVVFVAKYEHLLYPLIAQVFGWPIWTIRAAIFIRRWKKIRRMLKRVLPENWFLRFEAWTRKDTRRSIRNGVRKLVQPGKGCCIVIFPDAHRPTRKNIEQAIKDFGPYYPETTTPIRYTPVPFEGGFSEVIDAIQGPIRLLCVSSALDQSDNSIFESSRHVGGIFSIEVREITEEIPHDKESRRRFLNRLWANQIHWFIHRARSQSRSNIFALSRSRRA